MIQALLIRQLKKEQGLWVFRGCFNFQGIENAVYILEELTLKIFIDVLENTLISSANCFEMREGPRVFQQDGATAHTSEYTKTWFAENDIEMITWPYSPDFKLIENIWNWINKE